MLEPLINITFTNCVLTEKVKHPSINEGFMMFCGFPNIYPFSNIISLEKGVIMIKYDFICSIFKAYYFENVKHKPLGCEFYFYIIENIIPNSNVEKYYFIKPSFDTPKCFP